MAAAAPARGFSLFLLLLLASLHAHALTSKQGRPGQLSDPQAQAEAIQDIETLVTERINSDHYYGPGLISSTNTDLFGGLRLHTRLFLYNTGACFGEGVGLINGFDLVQAFYNNMVNTVNDQINRGFGFGVVVEGATDRNLLEEGLSAQFYFWVERIGQADAGGSTTNTKEAAGPSDNNPQRRNELRIIAGTSRKEKSSVLNDNLEKNSTSSTTNHTYWVEPPPRVRGEMNKTLGIKAQEEAKQDCRPFDYALFTSNYDINVLASSGYTGYPDIIYSPNQESYLVMQDDCNLVLYYTPAGSTETIPRWACGDACFRQGVNCFARINLDGTFAVYDGNGKNLWYTPTQCSSGPGCWSDTYLAMQDDGNLVLYLSDTNVPIWASHTVL